MIAVGGGIGAGDEAGLGAALGNVNLIETVEAYVASNDVIAAAGNGAKVTTPDGDLGAHGLIVYASGVELLGSFGAAGAGGQDAGVAGSAAVNTVTNTILAYINQGTTVNTGVNDLATDQAVDVVANQSLLDISIGGALGVAISPTDGGTAVTIGVGVATDVTSGTVLAYTDGATIDAGGGGIELTAVEAATIVCVALGGAVSASFGGDGGTSVGLAGAGCAVTIDDEVEADAQNGSSLSTTNGGNVSISSSDTTNDTANSGGVGFTAASGDGTSAGISFGTAVAVNVVTNTVEAYLDQSAVDSSGGVSVSATETATVSTLSIGGAVAAGASTGSGTSAGGAAAGAGSTNTVSSDVEAYDDGGGVSAAGGSIAIEASDTSVIYTTAGGLAAGVAGTAESSVVGVSLGISAATNIVTNQVLAWVSGADLTASGAITITAGETATIDALTVGGALAAVVSGGGTGVGIGGAGAGSGNIVETQVEAYATQGSDLVAQGGSVTLSATDSPTVIANAGGVGLTASIAGNGIGVSFGVAVAVNKEKDTVKAHLDNSGATASQGVSLSASEGGVVWALTIGGAVTAAAGNENGGAAAVAGASSANTVKDDVEATISGTPGDQADAVTAQGGSVQLMATDTTSIVANGGGVGFALGVGTGTVGLSLTLGLSAASNEVDNQVLASIDGSGVVASQGVSVSASETQASIEALTIGGAAAVGAATGTVGVGVGAAGAGSANTITNVVEAMIEGGTVVVAQDGDVTLTATDAPSITANGGGLGVSGGIASTAGVAVSLGVAFASNTMQDTVEATIADSSVTASGQVSLSASENAAIFTITIGGAIAVGGASTGGGGGAVAGADSYNSISNLVQASISGAPGDQSNSVTSSGGGVKLSATDTSTILSHAGGLGVGVGGASNVAIAATVGISEATNQVDNQVLAFIDGSNVSASNRVALSAMETATIEALTLGGAIGGAGTGGVGVGIGGAGAGSGNTIADTVEAYIQDGSTVSSTTGDVELEASNAPTITANAGGIGIGVGIGGTVGIAASLGVSFAANIEKDTVKAYIRHSQVIAAGNLGLTATENAKIKALTIGGAVAVGGGATGAGGVAIAGAGSYNTISNDVEASITGQAGKASDAVTAGGNVILMASDTSMIEAHGGAVGVAFGGASGLAISASVGISASVNKVDNTVKSSIAGASVTSAGDVSLSATEGASIESLTVVGALSGNVGGGFSVGVGGAGAGSGNTIGDDVEASISSGAIVVATGGDITLNAADTSVIDANGGGVAIHISGGGGAGIAASLGVAYAMNDITNTVKAFIDSSSATASGSVMLAATENDMVKSLTVGGAAAIGVAAGVGAGIAAAAAESLNTVANQVEAYVSDTLDSPNAAVTAQGGVLSIAASDASNVFAQAGESAISVGGGLAVGVGITIGASAIANTVTNTVLAYADDATLTADGSDLTLGACEVANVSGLAVGGAASGAGGVTAGVSVGGVGATSPNILGNTVEAYAQDGATLQTVGAGDIEITATDTSTADSQAVAGSAKLGVGTVAVGFSIGSSVAVNQINETVEAFSSDATLNSAGMVTIGATTSISGTSLSVAASVAVALGLGGSFAGGGAGSSNDVNDTVETYIDGASATNTSTVNAGGNVSVTATESIPTLKADVASGAFAAGLVGVSAGLSASVEMDTSKVTAYIDDASVTTPGKISIVSGSSGSITGVTIATSGALIIGVAAMGASTTLIASPNVSAYAGTGATLDAGDNIKIKADMAPQLSSTTGGISAAYVALGASTDVATIGGSVMASMEGTVDDSSGDGNLTVDAEADGQAEAQSAGLVGSALVSVAGSDATTENDPTVTSSLGAMSNVNIPGTLTVKAVSNPLSTATAVGVSVSTLAAVGEASATADSSSDVTASVGNHSRITAESVSILAQQSSGNIQNPTTTTAVAEASGGGSLIGATAAVSIATAGGEVEATAGNEVSLPDGDVTISASNTVWQSSTATGEFGGTIALGAESATAGSNDTTSASLGNSYHTHANRTGSLTIQANGTDQNLATTTSGSGGLIDGDVAVSKTTDTSSASANLGDGTLNSGDVTVSAEHNDSYDPSADSTNAAILNVSGAAATATASTPATVNIATGTQINATGTVVFSAQNQFSEVASGDNVSAGAGGVFSGSAGVSITTITGKAAVNVGNSVVISSESDSGAVQSGITVEASSFLGTSDTVKLSSGGAIDGAGVNSSLSATLDNDVTFGSNDNLTTDGDLTAATYTTANAANTSEVSTYGGVAVGAAVASTDVTTNQTVSAGTGSSFVALGNVNFTPGEDDLGNTTNLEGDATAEGYVRGFIAVPTASASSNIQSNATLDVASGDSVESAENTTIGAYPGTPSANADGSAQGYELGFIPVSTHDSSPSTGTTSAVTIDGTVAAGIYHTLDITIPNSKNSGKIFSSTISTNSGGAPYVSQFVPDFNPQSFIGSAFSGTHASLLDSGTSTSPVGAFLLGPLFASGGTVTVNAAKVSGSGSITAYGSPTITVTNESPDYLVLGATESANGQFQLTPNAAEIPDIPGGKVLFTGQVGLGHTGSVTVNQDGAGGEPAITVDCDYDTGSVGSVPYGPALFVTGEIDNLGGSISLTDLLGSYGQTAGIFGEQVDTYAPNGVGIIELPPPVPYISGSDPSSDWQNYMIWPGGNPDQGVPNPNLAIAYAANAQFNANGQYTTAAFIWLSSSAH